jgi:replicative DNA helicase
MQVSEEEKATLKEHLVQQRTINPPLYFRKAKTMMSVEELERLIQNLILEQQCRLIIIDHLHFLAPSKRHDSENENVAHSVRCLNSLALKYGVGILVVAHFRKQPDNQHQATIHEFRDSSAIEQTAHSILLLWRNLDGIGAAQYKTTIRIAKTRKDIPLSTVEVTFDPTSRQYL